MGRSAWLAAEPHAGAEVTGASKNVRCAVCPVIMRPPCRSISAAAMSPRFARRFRLSLNRRFFPCTERMHSGGRRRFIVNTLAAMKKVEKFNSHERGLDIKDDTFKGLLYIITFFGYINSLCARAARRLLPRAPGARSSQLNVTKTRTNGRPKRAGAHLRAMEATRPAGDRRGAPGSVLRLHLPPPSPDAPARA